LPIESGTVVGRYRVTRLVAQGGMAEVYRAEQALAGDIVRPVALKVIRSEYALAADFREMFLDEARTACTLAHPNIVHIYEVGEADGLLYMAMEFVPGESLARLSRALREKNERFGEEALLAVGIATCSALEAVHALTLPGQGRVNLVHRDVSPHNLLLDPQGTLKLIDFGIAKAVSNRNVTVAGVTKGKAGYFSPEQAMGRTLDGRSDLFSVGVTLYKLAFGATPFDEHRTHETRNRALVAGKWTPLSVACPELPRPLAEVVDRSMRLRPEERYPRAAEMRAALERVGLELGVHVGPSTLAGYVRPFEDGATVNERPPASGQRYLRPTVALGSSSPEAETAAPPTAAPPQVEPASGEPAVTDLSEAPPPSRGGAFWMLAGALVLLSVVVGLILGDQLARRLEPVPVMTAEPAVTDPEAWAIEVHAVTSGDEASDDEAASDDASEEAEVAPELADQVSAALAQRALAEATSRPRPPAKRTPGKRPKPPPEAKASPAAIQGGEGKLRIGGAQDGEVWVAGKSWGMAPVERVVGAGSYSVVVQTPGGQRLVGKVEVRADRTALLRFDFDHSRLSVDYL
jgi:eukaryotic-like serine/threonine-protein kinase